MTPFRIKTFAIAAVALLACAGQMAARADNPGVVEVRDPSAYSQVVAISDTHGEYAHLQTLLRSAGVTDAADHWVAGRTLMVVVGDSIDKGPQSIEVLHLWMRLQTEALAQKGRLIVLLGNHEAEFLADPNDKKGVVTRAEIAADHLTIPDLTDTARPMGAFLHSMPLAARIGDWAFCHAGWVPDELWPAFVAHAKATLAAGHYGDEMLIGDNSILEMSPAAADKKWWRSPEKIAELEGRLDRDGLAGVVFGHRPAALEITDNVGASRDGRMFKIDSGMAPPSKNDGIDGTAGTQPNAGHLLLFPHPAQLEAVKAVRGSIDAVSIDAQGHRQPVPVAAY